MITPPKLKTGDVLGVIAPSGPPDLARLRRGVDRFSRAFRVRLAPSITAPRDSMTPPFLSAPDEIRAAELNAMLGDPEVRGIIMAEGGHGALRILPHLDAALLRRDPKPIVGFSDGTALLAWAHAAGVRPISGSTLSWLGGAAEEAIDQLIHLLTTTEPLGVRPWQLEGAAGSGVHEGHLLVANLTMASVLVGTPWALPFDGALAILEEVGERPYRLDRGLTHLLLGGGLASASSVLIGDLERCGAWDDGNDALALATFRAALNRARLPHVAGAPVGHGRRNEALPFGAAASIDLDRMTIDVREAAVR